VIADRAPGRALVGQDSARGKASPFRPPLKPAGGIARASGRWRAIAARDGQEASGGIIRWGVGGSTSRAKRTRSWLRRNALVILGLFLASMGVAAAFWIAEGQNHLARKLETAGEIQENTRFVRQVVIDNAAEKPFRSLNLSGAALGGLNLACKNLDQAFGCADLMGARLSGADLTIADLSGAYMNRSDLSFAHLSVATLINAHLYFANLTHADLRGAILVGARLNPANLIDADLSAAKPDRRGPIRRGPVRRKPGPCGAGRHEPDKRVLRRRHDLAG
jgi:Pentapeptide repeats (8 copies)